MRSAPPLTTVRVALALGAGAALRLWGIADQVILGDELHTVRNALRSGLGEILTTYLPVDPCLPLSALARLYLEMGLPLTEALLRWPSLLSGIATVVLLPLLLGRDLGPRRTLLWAVLLAVSPTLVYYSRIGRPYAVVALLAPLALILFWRYWEGGSARGAAGYAAVGAGAAWFHLGALPFVAAPVLFGGLDLAVRWHRRGWREARPMVVRLAVAAGGLAALVAAYLLPALPSFLRLVRRKSGTGPPPELSTVTGVLGLQAGSAEAWVSVLFWLAAVSGAVTLLRRAPRPVLLALCAVGLQWLAIAAVARPQGVALPLILHRYLLPVLPVVLLAVAAGLDRLWRCPRPAGPIVAGGILALLLGAHPFLADPALHLGPWAGSNRAATLLEPEPELEPGAIPSPYRVIAGEPGDGAVVEVPAKVGWWATRAQMARWRIHRRPVVLATDVPWVADPRLRFGTLVAAQPGAVEGAGRRFVSVTLDPERARRPAPGRAAFPGRSVAGDPGEAAGRSEDRLADRFEAAWGPPHLTGDGVLVWDLARVPSAP